MSASRLDRRHRRVEGPTADGGEHVGHLPAVGAHGAALDQPPADEPVDHRGDTGGAHGQTFGQIRRDGRAFVEEAEHAVLGSERSAEARPISTCLASHAAVRPRVSCSSAGGARPRPGATLVLLALRVT